MNYGQYSALRAEARAAFDSIEDWMADVFGNNRDKFLGELDRDDLDSVAAQKRRGMRYFAAGRCKDQQLFASWLFPMFQGDPHVKTYRESIMDILKVAGQSVAPKTRHKLAFDLGVLYFTADTRGNMYGTVASEDYPMNDAFKFLEEMLEIYEGIDINAAMEKTDSAVWKEDRLRDDAFGIKDLSVQAWKKLARPHDGTVYNKSNEVLLGEGEKDEPQAPV
eukprot:CAMPEP_0178397286 /NCGR_PEP_ID=MMETSP0689_2-20121128/14166_1 /TAXON_ID=160604 /ORGANISM="Amphidinium massartii, Strain CS-259" /LENGTH=220 /DNA_ID=CAMNT_0020017987 /DNA_START=109 /DNA_END=767 /DNA_ORIENTATION=-